MEKHNIAPVYDENSKILILGSFPSVKSRENQFFYAHPQNRFWRVMSRILNEDCPKDIYQKKNMLLNRHIAVWDVIESCEIKGSSDSSVKDETPNDLSVIFKTADIKAVFANGGLAYKLYLKYNDKNIIKLPSTSPANAAYSLERLTEEWGRALGEFLT